MFKAKLTKDTGETVTITLPQDYSPLSEAVASLGTRLWPEHIPMDRDADKVRGELIPENEMGEHLRRLLPDGYTLQDANDIAHMVTHANKLIEEDLGLKILFDHYSSAQEMRDDIRKMTYDAGSESKSYYFPLTGVIWDEECEDEFPAGKAFLLDQWSGILDGFSKYTSRDINNMSVYFRGPGADKLLLADWGFIDLEDELYGIVDVRLTEPMTKEEEKELRDWICGQNSDGLGEGFEQWEIPTGRGNLYVSFWDSGKDYFIKDDAEMDEYLGHTGQQFGGM